MQKLSPRALFDAVVLTFLGAIAFYTCLPIPHRWPLRFHGIARWVPIVGLLIGGMLGIADWGMAQIQVPPVLRGAAIVLLWIGITGGLHLDGAMDTADGLAVLEPNRRLAVMADSRTGAFGVMAAIAIVLLKTTALQNLLSQPMGAFFSVMAAAAWGRWGQLVAIAAYPYLKPEGKGAFHKAAIRSIWESVPTGILLLGFSVGLGSGLGYSALALGLITGASILVALATGAWLNRQLGGHTGDTYGAVVEWTEALLLCLMATLINAEL
jgi:adenosylcobinamide-GDP ribazoletransferase